MATVSVEKCVEAPIEKVFSSFADEFEDIYKYNPNINSSRLLDISPTPTGVGALRQCDLKDGKNWLREKVIGFEKNKQIVIDVYETSLPLKSNIATFDFESVSTNATIVRIKSEFQPGFGVIGKLMAPMMKKKFKPMLQALLDANAAYVERGEQANETLNAA